MIGRPSQDLGVVIELDGMRAHSTPQLGGSRNSSMDGDEWQRRRSTMYRRESNISESVLPFILTAAGTIAEFSG